MNINKTVGHVHILLQSDRIDERIREAQKLLNEQIVSDCDDYIPFMQGTLKGSVRYPKTVYGGEIMWDTPYAHYQYVGTVYGPNYPILDAFGNLIGWRSPKGKKKYPTDRQLQYHTPGTGKEWFEEAKRRNLNNWVNLVDRTVRGQ